MPISDSPFVTFTPIDDGMEIRIYGKQDKKGNFDINIKTNARTAKYIEKMNLLELVKHIEKLLKEN